MTDLQRTVLQASEDGLSWVACPLAGEAWHCGVCGVGILNRQSHACRNCLAAVREVQPQPEDELVSI